MLDDLAFKNGTDKGTRKANALGPKHYTLVYERLLRERRMEPLALLEIGIGNGGSLRMWRDYLPNATIHGVDINQGRVQRMVGEPRIFAHCGDQSDIKFLGHLGLTHGPFDFIVDDGGHRMEQHRVSFDALFPFLRAGGWYAIEDLHTAYDSQYGVTDKESTMRWLKTLADDVNGQGERNIASLHFHKSLAVIVKGQP